MTNAQASMVVGALITFGLTCSVSSFRPAFRAFRRQRRTGVAMICGSALATCFLVWCAVTAWRSEDLATGIDGLSVTVAILVLAMVAALFVSQVLIWLRRLLGVLPLFFLTGLVLLALAIRGFYLMWAWGMA